MSRLTFLLRQAVRARETLARLRVEAAPPEALEAAEEREAEMVLLARLALGKELPYAWPVTKKMLAAWPAQEVHTLTAAKSSTV